MEPASLLPVLVVTDLAGQSSSLVVPFLDKHPVLSSENVFHATVRQRCAENDRSLFLPGLGIGPGETTPDLEYTLLTVNCLGCCALGPVVVVGNDYHSVAPGEAEALVATGARGGSSAAAPAGKTERRAGRKEEVA